MPSPISGLADFEDFFKDKVITIAFNFGGDLEIDFERPRAIPEHENLDFQWERSRTEGQPFCAKANFRRQADLEMSVRSKFTPVKIAHQKPIGISTQAGCQNEPKMEPKSNDTSNTKLIDLN